MSKYVLDTNVYASALASGTGAEALAAFLRAHIGETSLTAVVLQELRVSARTEEQVAALRTAVIEPFARRRRIVVPSAKAF